MLLNFTGTCEERPREIGGFSFQTNQAGLIARKTPTHLARNQYFFKRQKNLFLYIQSTFKNISPGQKIAWSEIPVLYPQTDKCGNTYYLSTIQLYNKINSCYFLINSALTYSPPAQYSIPGNAGFNFSASYPDEITIQLSGYPFTASDFCEVWATPFSDIASLSSSRHFTRLYLFRPTISEFNGLTSLLSIKYGTPKTGQHVNIAIRFCNSLSYLWSDFYFLSSRLEPPIP